MKILTILNTIFFIMCSYVVLAQAAEHMKVTISDSSLLPILNEYSQQTGEKSVAILIQERNKGEYTYYLTAANRMSTIISNPPAAYTVVNGKIFLIYSGLEQIGSQSVSNREQIISIVKPHLHNDILSDNKTINPNFPPPLYDPLELRVKIKDGKVISRDPGYAFSGQIPYLTR